MLDKSLAEVIRTTQKHLSDLKDIGIRTARDLLLYFPWRYADETEFSSINEVYPNTQVTLQGVITKIWSKRTKFGKTLISASFQDETGSLEVMWFNQTFLLQLIKPNTKIVLSGKVTVSGSKLMMVSPKYEIPKVNASLVHTGRLVPVYHESGKISSKWLREKIVPLLYLTNLFEDALPAELSAKYNLTSYSEALKQVHFPDSAESLESARYRLGFEEVLILQLKAIQRKYVWKEYAAQSEKKVVVQAELIQEFLELLSFKLTKAQERVVGEITEDLKGSLAMSRLLEGDVGSGKTIVSALAIFVAVKSNYQACMMVPTEILAKQHYQTLFKLFKGAGLNIQLLVGSLTKSVKDEVKNGIANGTINIVVGTHALIQESVNFNNLGLAVIDEQHRFGVNQRAVLSKFGAPHMLAMTATPIPRTLALTLYGDQDLSIIDELPPNRRPIVTRIVPAKKRMEAYLWIKSQIDAGRQAFIVCSLIEESEVIEAKSAVLEYERLQEEVFQGYKLGVLHGKMRQADKDDIMQKFANREIDILVATTVIEVGIDVPNASIMVIEDADRFGLAQLHQLRGRVGRGGHQSYCFLFLESNSSVARKRMKAMVDYADGFKLAEIDLELRGPGEVYGVRQSGIPDLKMASLSDVELLSRVRQEAELLLKDDLNLSKYGLLAERIRDSEVVS